MGTPLFFHAVRLLLPLAAMNFTALAGEAPRPVSADASPATASTQAQELSRPNYGQVLVDRLLLRNPDVLLAGLHVNLPDDSRPDDGRPDDGRNIIIASNFGRLGKPADEDDLGVMRSGQAKAEPNEARTRYAVELPMHDVSGATIGALGLNFRYQPGDDVEALGRRAVLIRDELARHSEDAAALMAPHPWHPMSTTLTRAQKLLDERMRATDAPLAMAIYAASATDPRMRVVASSTGGIGRPATEAEGAVAAGTPMMRANPRHAERQQVAVPLLDAEGRVVGVLELEYLRGAAGADDPMRRTVALRDGLRASIASRANLVSLEP